ncbi:hypothetical protein FPRO04_14758 [Fusarium proliferatum]|nr:hypothetical protein FPRO04_14758 [Fusarium proliferatum]
MYAFEPCKEQKEKCALSNHPQLEARVLASWFKFDKYCKLTDDTPIYAAAVLLHPAYRKGYFDTHWGHQRQYIEPTIKAARKLWQKHFKPRSEELTPTSQSSNIGQMENPFRRFKAQAAGAIHDQLRDEFDDFIWATPHIIGEQSALDWWLKPARQFVYPNLSKMAITIFSIPPMSAEPERVFSGTKHTIAPERIRRGAEM